MKRKIYRPLRIVHGGFGYQSTDSYEEKCQRIRLRIEDLKEKGFGGIVTNVADKDYMEDDEELKLMEEKVKVCKELGMRMWLYDEKAYPSGGAGVLTLRKNPDFEARGLVLVSHILAPGERLTQKLPYKHEKLIAAVTYIIEGEAPTDEELQAPYSRPFGDPIEFINDTNKNLLCLAFYSKHLYEGTHAQNNVSYRRRYIDVSNPEAIAEYINNTYRPYTLHVGNYYANDIGDENENAVIEAIFTDEPSYQGVYINKGIACANVTHEPDENITLYPLVNWGKNLTNRFINQYGYRLEDHLTCLFMGHSEKACQVRHDYYQLLSDLYENAFFAQLSDYCASVGLNFSGHILLEDELPFHVMFEGNFFNLLRHMHIPGIDMLVSTPDTVWKLAFTPKLVRSIGELHGRHHVMDEASAHFHGGNVTPKEMYVSLMIQLALGADVFTFYYSDVDPDGEKKKVYDAMERATEAIDGVRLSDTLLYYPIETMMRHRKPLQHSFEDCHEPLIQETEDPDGDIITACNHAMLEAQYTLFDAQKSFTYIDAGTALKQQGDRWKSFVIGACDITAELQTALTQLSQNGTRIIWYAPKGSEVFAGEFQKLPSGSLIASTPEELIALVRPEGPVLTAKDGTTEGIVLAETADTVLLVNRKAEAKTLSYKGTIQNLTDAFTGESIAAENGCFAISGYQTFILKK